MNSDNNSYDGSYVASGVTVRRYTHTTAFFYFWYICLLIAV